MSLHRQTIPLAQTLHADHQTRREAVISAQKSAVSLCNEAHNNRTKSKEAYAAVILAIRATNDFGGRELQLQTRLNSSTTCTLSWGASL